MSKQVLSRREWLRLASAGVLGAGVAPWFPAFAEQAAKNPARKRSCILLWMNGGPSQMDTFDLKPGHANGGPFKTIQTNAPGLEISEYLPKLAKFGDQLAVMRGMNTKEADHSRATYLMRTGQAPTGPIQYPPIGSLVAKELGSADAALPSYISIAPYRFFNPAAFLPGFLGPMYAPLVVGEAAAFRPQQGGQAVDYANFLKVQDIDRPADVTADQANARLDLLTDMDAQFAAGRPSTSVSSHQSAYERAIRLARGEAAQAFNLEEEKAAVRDRYGRSLFGQGCLLARRLVERNVPFVEVTLAGVDNQQAFGWDTHGQNFEAIKRLSAVLDPAWSTLMEDLKERGLLETTTILWMGEFGRTPKINQGQGRDHYATAWTTVLAGGGIKGGQAYGKTSADGTTVEAGQTGVGDLLATLCLALGINPEKQNNSNIGRPLNIVEKSAVAVKEVRPVIALDLILALALAAPVDAPAPEVKPAGAEVQDLLLLHEDGPMRVRLRITNAEQSVFARWHEHLGRWFNFADRNKDGFIEAGEIDRVANVVQMQYMMQSGQFLQPNQLGQNAAITLKDMDADGDGKIDLHEFLTYYVTTSAGPLLVQAGYSQLSAQGINSSAISDALFRALDANRDGRLTSQELGRASELLGRFDINDDEIVSASEILGNQGQQFNPNVNIGRTAGFSLNLVAVPREASDLRVTARLKFAKEMITRLDTDKNGGLDAKEFRITPVEFAGCDANKDGQLDALELVKWLVSPPHLAANVRMDRLVDSSSAVAVTGDGIIKDTETADGLGFRVGDASIQFDRNSTVANPGYNPGQNMKQYMTQIFNAADTQKTGRLSMEEINKNPQTVYLRTQSKWLDMDGDGFLTLKEIEDFVQLTSGGAYSQLVIGFLDQGRGLFEILDTQADYSLSIGELRKAPKTLATYQKPGQDSLARTDIPRRYHLLVANNNGGGQVQMRTPGQPAVVVRQPGINQGQRAVPRKGPMWFQKMDVNADTYVSPREFLGPMPAFQKMDADGDGLISDTEATDFETKQPGVSEGRKPEAITETPIEK